MVDKTYKEPPSHTPPMEKEFKVKTAKLTKKEDKFWEEVYNQLIKWSIHEDFTYDLCFTITKAKFKRLKGVDKLI